MKEKRAGRIIILVAFAVIICMSGGIWFFVEKFFDSVNYENRQMATQPRMTLDNYGTFSSDYTTYFNDNLQFRKQLITINSAIDFYVFDKSASEGVIKGDNGWLFLSGTLPDYQGTNLYSQEELEAIKNDVIETQEFFHEKGIEFVIFIGPNKNTIYGDYMPKYLSGDCETSRVRQMVDYLQDNTDVRVIFPDEELISAREQNPNLYYYFHLDTHWNYMGGYWGTRPLLQCLDVEPIAFEELNYEEINEPIFLWNGYDEANMLGLSDILRSDVNYRVSGSTIDSIQYVGDAPHKVDDFYNVIRTYNIGTDQRKVFLARDSFGEAITPFLAASFNEVYSVHRGSPFFSRSQIDAETPDVFIYEAVEREISPGCFNYKNWAE